jgi:cytidine deaminase
VSESVVSVIALEIAAGREDEFLSLTGEMQAIVRRKGYGINQLLRDGVHPARFYDIRIWRNATAAARAESDRDVADLRQKLARYLKETPLVDVALAVELGLMTSGPWQERRSSNDRRRAPSGYFGVERRIGPRRLEDTGQADVVRSARLARDKAEAGFSNFKVGAALETTDGLIVTGCNIENATYGLTMCAERVAMFKALSEGHRSFRRIAVVADTNQPTSPCGACRQVLWEFGGNLEIILGDMHRVTSRHHLHDLLPHPFDARFIE